MSIQKCAAIVMGVLVLCTACGKNAPDLERHPYTEEEKIQLSSNGGYYVYNPGLEANCILSDLVIEGIILDGAVTDEAHSFIGSGTSKKSFAYTYTAVSYTHQMCIRDSITTMPAAPMPVLRQRVCFFAMWTVMFV